MEKKFCEAGCDNEPVRKEYLPSDLSFLEGCLKDIRKLKQDENYLVRPRLQCEGFTAQTVEGKKMEELALLRRIVWRNGFAESLKCTCPENMQLIEKIKKEYSDELSLETVTEPEIVDLTTE